MSRKLSIEEVSIPIQKSKKKIVGTQFSVYAGWPIQAEDI
jgi:hypothetical protein